MKFEEVNQDVFFERYKQAENSILIDVREEYEHEEVNLGGINIPMGQILAKSAELDKYAAIFLYCKSGKRSKTAAYHLCDILTSHQILTLTGGIQAYKH